MGWFVSTGRLKQLLLAGQSLVYLIAFSSLYYQIPGLYSENGITPIAARLEKCDAKDAASCHAPLVFLITVYTGARPSTALHLIALVGIALSVLTLSFKKLRSAFFYFVLVSLYLSAFQVGGTFLWFQWDTLLLESGWLAVVLASFWNSPADVMSTYLFRFLAARLMFASGVVKLQSQCPTWWGLTALDIHFESQCLPTPLAYFAHNQPEWIRRLGVALTFLIEVYLPPLFLLPIPLLRWVAGVPQIIFMVAIALTGNYNFFNLHYAIICLSCLEGSYSASQKSGTARKFLEFLATGAIIGFVLHHWAASFGVQFDAKTSTILTKITFSKAEFAQFVKYGTSVVVHLGIIGFVFAFLHTVAIHYRLKKAQAASEPRSAKKGKKGAAAPKHHHVESLPPTVRHGLFVLLFGSFLFWISFVPFTVIDDSASDRIPDVLRAIHQRTKSFEFSHSYGLFRQMTGVEGRPEIILEGATNPNGPWTEIEFFAKPGKVNEAPTFVAPHQPRLDWQMWFAALGSYQNNPWFLSFANRLLNHDADVIHLLKKWPFAEKKNELKFLRAQLYIYHFTKGDAKAWWKRSLQHEYMPIQTKDTPAILEYLAKNNLLATKKYKDGPIDRIVKQIHEQARLLSQTVFVWSTSSLALLFALLG